MDPKMIEMNNLRLLNDYLNQTIDVLVRGPRFGNGQSPGFGPSSFGGTTGGTDVYGPSPFNGPGMPFVGMPMLGSMDPFIAQRSMGGGMGWQPSWGQGTWGPGSWGPSTWGAGSWGPGSWGPGSWGPGTFGPSGWGQGTWEAARQAQYTQALAAKQTVLEAMCRACGLPV